MRTSANEFQRLVNHPVKFPIFLLSKLPSAFFSGVRVKTLQENSCEVSVPFTWFSKNPFRSTYFACLAMAAEMSTGLLAMMHTHQRQPSVSMLVTGLTANYFKKATGTTIFRCQQGQMVAEAIERAATTGEAQTIIMHSAGHNNQGEQIAEFLITWSFKSKQL
jgi:acyl-coenzyme A thioesterase PaaI-like protein